MSVSVLIAFYRQIRIEAVLILGIFFFFYCLFRDTKRRIQNFRKQFCDFLLFLTDSFHTGNSLENALIRCHRELIPIWGEKEDICRELEGITKIIQVRGDLPGWFYDLGKRSGVEEVELFAEMLEVSSKAGGNMIQIAQNVLRILRRKINLEDDIRAVIASSLFQQKVMNYMPLAILLYIQFTAYSFVKPMYVTTFGRYFMTVFLLVYGGTVVLGIFLQRGNAA